MVFQCCRREILAYINDVSEELFLLAQLKRMENIFHAVLILNQSD